MTATLGTEQVACWQRWKQQRRNSASALAVLRWIASTRPAEPARERRETCAEPIPHADQHVVDLEKPLLLPCTRLPRELLFTDSSADLRYRSVL